jgi:hypothetical protein
MEDLIKNVKQEELIVIQARRKSLAEKIRSKINNDSRIVNKIQMENKLQEYRKSALF